MTSALLLATTVTLAATSSGQPKVSLDCSDFIKRPQDGTWIIVRTTILVITNVERRTRLSFPAAAGTRFPPGAKATPPAMDDGFPKIFKNDPDGVDVVGELESQCR